MGGLPGGRAASAGGLRGGRAGSGRGAGDRVNLLIHLAELGAVLVTVAACVAIVAVIRAGRAYRLGVADENRRWRDMLAASSDQLGKDVVQLDTYRERRNLPPDA